MSHTAGHCVGTGPHCVPTAAQRLIPAASPSQPLVQGGGHPAQTLPGLENNKTAKSFPPGSALQSHLLEDEEVLLDRSPPSYPVPSPGREQQKSCCRVGIPAVLDTAPPSAHPRAHSRAPPALGTGDSQSCPSTFPFSLAEGSRLQEERPLGMVTPWHEPGWPEGHSPEPDPASRSSPASPTAGSPALMGR